MFYDVGFVCVCMVFVKLILSQFPINWSIFSNNFPSPETILSLSSLPFRYYWLTGIRCAWNFANSMTVQPKNAWAVNSFLSISENRFRTHAEYKIDQYSLQSSCILRDVFYKNNVYYKLSITRFMMEKYRTFDRKIIIISVYFWELIAETEKGASHSYRP